MSVEQHALPMLELREPLPSPIEAYFEVANRCNCFHFRCEPQLTLAFPRPQVKDVARDTQ